MVGQARPGDWRSEMTSQPPILKRHCRQPATEHAQNFHRLGCSGSPPTTQITRSWPKRGPRPESRSQGTQSAWQPSNPSASLRFSAHLKPQRRGPTQHNTLYYTTLHYTHTQGPGGDTHTHTHTDTHTWKPCVT